MSIYRAASALRSISGLRPAARRPVLRAMALVSVFRLTWGTIERLSERRWFRTVGSDSMSATRFDCQKVRYFSTVAVRANKLKGAWQSSEQTQSPWGVCSYTGATHGRPSWERCGIVASRPQWRPFLSPACRLIPSSSALTLSGRPTRSNHHLQTCSRPCHGQIYLACYLTLAVSFQMLRQVLRPADLKGNCPLSSPPHTPETSTRTGSSPARNS